MSSAPATSQHSKNPELAHPIPAYPENTFQVARPMIAPSKETRLTRTAGNRRHTLGHNPVQSGYAQYQRETINTLDTSARRPLANPGLIDQWGSDNSPTAGATAIMSPSPPKRAFSSSYVSSNSMLTPDMEFTPSPKRRGRPVVSARRKTVAETVKIANPISLNRQSIDKAATSVKNGHSTTSRRINSQNIGDVPKNVAEPGDSKDFSKYYEYLAQKNGMQLKQTPKADNIPSKTHMPPYASVDTLIVREGKQKNPVAAHPGPSLRHPETLYNSQPVNMPIGQYGYQGSSRHLSGPQSKMEYGQANEWLRRMPQNDQKYQRQPNNLQKNEQGSAYTNTSVHPNSVGSSGNVRNFNPNPYIQQYQPVQGHVKSNQQLGTQFPKSSNYGHSNLDLRRQMADDRAQMSRPSPGLHFSTDPSRNPFQHNHPVPTYSIQNQQPEGGLYQQFPDSSFASALIPMGSTPPYYASTQPYHPTHGVDEFGAPPSNRSSSLPSPAYYSQTRQPFATFNFNPLLADSQMFTAGAVGIDSRSKGHGLFEANVRNGNGARTNLPEWEAKTLTKTTMKPYDTNPEDGPMESIYPEPSTQPSEGALAPCPLPNINQSYTGNPTRYRPFDASQYPDGPVNIVPIPLHIHNRKDRSKAKRKSPVFWVGKAPPPRTSTRVKKTTQSIFEQALNQPIFEPQDNTQQSEPQTFLFQPTLSRNVVSQYKEQTSIRQPITPQKSTPDPNGQTSLPQSSTPSEATSHSNDLPSTPPPITPRPATPRPPIFDFSGPASRITGSSTIARMLTGNYAEFFRSPEEETKWKQDAVARSMAKIGTPSKYQLKKEEADRKRMEKEAKKGKK